MSVLPDIIQLSNERVQIALDYSVMDRCDAIHRRNRLIEIAQHLEKLWQLRRQEKMPQPQQPPDKTRQGYRKNP